MNSIHIFTYYVFSHLCCLLLLFFYSLFYLHFSFMCTESYFWSFYLWEMFEFSCPLPPYLTYPISPTVNILKHHVLLGIINEPILTHYQLRPIIYPYFISIYLIVFLFRIPSYVTHYIIYCFPYLPISSDCFSELPCFWRLWELWAFLTWYFGEWPTIWMYVMLYSDYKGVMSFQVNDYKGKVLFSSYSVKLTYHLYSRSVSNNYGRDSFVMFPHCKVIIIFFLPLFILCS